MLALLAPDSVFFFLSVLLACYLFVGALYDAHGALVPDDVTVPYAILGLIAALIQHYWFTFAFGIFALIFALYGREPAWMKALGQKLLMHSYKSEDAIMELERKHEEIADKFELRFGKVLHATLVLFICGIIMLPLLYLFTSEINTTSVLVAIAVFALVLFGYSYVYKGGDSPAVTEDEALCAFGGADVLILIGLFGYYGMIAFTFALVPTFAVYLIWSILAHFISGEKVWGGCPMLPAVFCTISLRLYVVGVLCEDLILSCRFSFSDLASLVYLFR